MNIEEGTYSNATLTICILLNLLTEGEYRRRNLLKRLTYSCKGEQEKKELNQTSGLDVLDKVQMLQRTLARMIAVEGKEHCVTIDELITINTYHMQTSHHLIPYECTTAYNTLDSARGWSSYSMAPSPK